jgi:hypothetical protein
MALIICDKHGQQGIYNLCSHLDSQFMDGKLSGVNIIRDELGFVFYMCDFCIKKYNIKENELLNFDNVQNLDDDFRGYCCKCVDNL